ncbi:MAG: hypothetical protein AUH92_04190 [Acidobacteria bacterium 13_1_40CM_4_69_4]|nr:MAG: hypothetical protein AUH92_04190 [Acidobacteria bacterium 13_1_40CM_4_69_4]
MSAAPVRYVALYDGDCGFCARWRDRMIARDPKGVVEWLSLHDPSVATRFPGIDRDDALRQMYVYAADGTFYKGAEGWRELFRVLRGLSWAAALYRIPGVPFVMDRVYRFIAARRYRLSCAGSACRLPGAGGAGAGGGPRAVTVVLALLVPACLTAGSSSGCSGRAPDPVTERLDAIADPEAAAVVLASFEAYGPYPVWRAHHNVEYTYRLEFYGGGKEPQAVSRQTHRLDLGPGARSFAQDLEGDVPQVVRVDGDRLEVTRAGVPVVDPAQLDFPRAFIRIARWSFLLPWDLIDPEARLQYRGERTPPMASRVPSDLCDVVRLTFDEKDPSRRDDWHDIYVSRVNHLIDRIHSYRAEDRSYSVVLWSDHLTFGGVRVATRRETHATDVTGEIGALEAVVEYSGVHFDAPFGDEVWSGMTATAPITTAGPPSLPAAAGPLQAPGTGAPPDDGTK